MNPTYTSPKDKAYNLNKIMNLWADSGRKWSPETESEPNLNENICIIEISPFQWITTLLPNDPNIHVS